MKKILYLSLFLISLNALSVELEGMKVSSVKGEPFQAIVPLKDARNLKAEDVSLKQSISPFLKNKEMMSLDQLKISIIDTQLSQRLLQVTSSVIADKDYYDFIISINTKNSLRKRYFGFLPKEIRKELKIITSDTNSNDLSSCLELPDPDQRLRCYDKSLSRASNPLSVIADSNGEITSSEYGNELFGQSDRQLRKTIERKENVSLPNKIVSEIRSKKRYQEDRYIIILKNDQRWKILEPIEKNLLKKDIKVTVSKGLFGSFNLAIDDQNRKYKVRRVE